MAYVTASEIAIASTRNAGQRNGHHGNRGSVWRSSGMPRAVSAGFSRASARIFPPAEKQRRYWTATAMNRIGQLKKTPMVK